MRKLNMFLVIGMILTFAAHGIMGAVKLMGADSNALKVTAWIGVAFIAAHVIVTFILTAETLHARKHSGVGYFKDNLMFWTRRISGFAIIIPLLMHLLIFHSPSSGAFRLQTFNTGKLISQILLVAALALHIITNIEPVFISFGVKDTKSFSADLIFVLSVILLFTALAFLIYYLRWAAV